MSRVIFAWNYIEWGGAQIHFLALIREARKYLDILVLLPEGTDPQFLGFLEEEGIRYEQFRGSIDLAQKSGVKAKLARHWQRIKSEHAMLRKIGEAGLTDTIVHTDISPGQSLLSLVWLCLRTSVFITLHNAQPAVSRLRWTLWKLKYGVISRFENFHVFCTNEHAANYYRQLFSGRVARDIKLTYDSINPVEIDEALRDKFDREAELRNLGIPDNNFIVLTVGQFIDRKGRWTLLDAAEMVKAKTEDIRFVWVTPSLPNNCEADRIAEYDHGETFRLIRSADVGTDRRSILRFYQIADIFALPSFVEGIPIALLEAMAAGIPCISTNVYGIPEAIIHEKTGLLIEAGDPGALADAIMRLHKDTFLRAEIARGGRDRARSVFDERIAARTAVSEYKKAFGSNEL
jgi:glycosyltransferase involved in cell wall biosynthesis